MYCWFILVVVYLPYYCHRVRRKIAPASVIWFSEHCPHGLSWPYLENLYKCFPELRYSMVLNCSLDLKVYYSVEKPLPSEVMKLSTKSRFDSLVSITALSFSVAVLVCLSFVFVGCSSSSSPRGLYFVKARYARKTSVLINAKQSAGWPKRISKAAWFANSGLIQYRYCAYRKWPMPASELRWGDERSHFWLSVVGESAPAL